MGITLSNTINNKMIKFSVNVGSPATIMTLDGNSGGSVTFSKSVTVADGANDFNIASHDGSNGLKLGGILVQATATELNLLSGSTTLTQIASLSCTGSQVIQRNSDNTAWQCGANRRRRLLSKDGTLFSDKRLKKDIQTIQNASEKLQNIRGVTYYFDENIHTKDIKHLPEKEQIGVIAQEVEKVLPQVVTENDNGVKKVDYSSLTGFLIQVNKEQEVKLEKQEFRLEKQQAQLDQLTMLLKEERQDRKLSEQNNRFERNIMFAFISLTICFMFLFQKRNEKSVVLQQRTLPALMKEEGTTA